MALVNGFMLYVGGKPTEVVEGTLEQAKKAAEPYIASGQTVSVQNASGRIYEWYFDASERVWVETGTPGQRS